jgi:hypothetical protein
VGDLIVIYFWWCGRRRGCFESICVKSKVFSMFEKGKDPIDVVIERICMPDITKSLWEEG